MQLPNNLITRLWSHIARKRKLQFAMLLILSILSAFAEVVSLGTVLPFLAALAAPETVFNHPYATIFIQVLRLESPDQLVLPLAILFAITAILAGIIRLLLSWFSIYVSNAAGADLSIKLYEITLYQPYRVHVSRNSSEVIAGIQKVGSAQAVVNACISMISAMLLVVFIMSALLAINTKVAIIAAIFFLICYSAIVLRMRNQLESNSELVAAKQTRMIKALQEGLGGIRDVLLDGSQLFYSNIFSKAQIPAMRATSRNTFIAAAPRNIMEALSLCLIAALAYSLSRDQGAMSSALPVLGALALGAQRMLPAIQMLYGSWAGIMGNTSQLTDVLELLDQQPPELSAETASKPLSFQEVICFDDVRFRYSDDSAWVLNGINIRIPKGARVAFVGITGSGKSTILDLLMGLLQPTTGKISVDGKVIDNKTERAWQQNITHVPQSIYLADTSIAENIAFGVQQKDINIEEVKRAASLAQIDHFIETKPDKYDTVIGEYGIRLSGGQRQRIGIARALYKPSDVLILDEATSALDNATESAVVNSIESLGNELTSIIVAHRITTVMGCDIIIEIKDGLVSHHGTYEELLNESKSFRDMVQARANSDPNPT